MEENLNIKEMVREEIHVTEAVGGETVPPAGTPEKAKQETKPKQQQRKELTPAEIQRRKKMLVYPLIFMVFAGAMWLIFAPSSAEKEDSIQEGFNIDVPLPHEKGMPGDKKEAYEQDAFEKQQKEKMGTLQDFDIAFGEPDGQATVSDPPAAPPEEDAPVRSTSSPCMHLPSLIRTLTGNSVRSINSLSRKTTRNCWNWNGVFRRWNANRKRNSYKSRR